LFEDSNGPFSASISQGSVQSHPFKITCDDDSAAEAWGSVIWLKAARISDIQKLRSFPESLKFESVVHAMNDLFRTKTGRQLEKRDYAFVLRILNIRFV